MSEPLPGKTVLLVENNDVEREGLIVLLARAGYRVLAVKNGQEALDYLQDNPPPSLILLAMLMPVLDGWRFLDRFQALPLAKSVPVIIVTGTVLNREWALTHGCAGFVCKPIDTDALFAEIRNCLGK